MESGPGVPFSSGLIAGATITGMAVALCYLTEPSKWLVNHLDLSAHFPAVAEAAKSDVLALGLFLVLAAVLWLVSTERILAGTAEKG